MTSWAQERRLELVFDKTLDGVHKRLRKVGKRDRKALRREFAAVQQRLERPGHPLKLEHYKAWEGDE